nr:hypothetical protein [Tanacetum cinerariifolium]
MEIKDKLDLDQTGTPIDAMNYRSMDSGFELTVFSDAEYAGCKDIFKSTSGGAQFLGEKLVSWSLKKQDCTALSTAEAEYVSLSACCAQVLWMRTQLTDYGFHFDKIPIYCDSKSAIAISCNPAKPTEKRLKEVKRIFCYLSGTVNTGLWYTRDSGFELIGFSDADYAGCKDTFKSTSGIAQFLAEKLDQTTVLQPHSSGVEIQDLPCSIIKDKYMMKAQVHVLKSSAISDIQALPRKKHYCQIYHVERRLYMAVEETLKVFNQWLCGKCMDLHAVSRACHHPDGLVRLSKGSDDMNGYIFGISKPSNKESKTEITKGLVLDTELLDRVFKVPITTVYRLKNRQERRSENRKSLQQSSILKSLAMLGKDDGITTQVKSILDSFALGSFGQGLGDFLEEGATSNTNIKQCLRKVADGHFTAVKVLSSFDVAPYCDDTIKALEAKHPYKPSPYMPSITFSEPPLVAMKGVGKEMSKYLSDFQFVVRVSGGAEAILHGVNRVLSEYHNDRSLAILTVDFSNVFNLVDRSALLHEVRVNCPSISLWVDFSYGHVSRLYIGDTHIWSATRVQQGDPLRPLLFALILHPLLHKIIDSCKLLLYAWYLDDGTVIGDSEEVARVPSSGVKLFGGAVSRDTDFISGLAMRRAANAVDLMGLLPQLHDPHSEFFLLRSCIVEYRTILKYRLMIPLFPVDGIFPVCCKSRLDSFGEHAVHCKEIRDLNTDTIWLRTSFLTYVGVLSAKKEAPVNFLTDPSDGISTLRPADILVFGWVGGKHTCMDLTVVSPLVGLSSRGVTTGHDALKAASRKVTKHEKACIENQHVFIPFAFDTFGFLARRSCEDLSYGKKNLQPEIMPPPDTDTLSKAKPKVTNISKPQKVRPKGKWFRQGSIEDVKIYIVFMDNNETSSMPLCYTTKSLADLRKQNCPCAMLSMRKQSLQLMHVKRKRILGRDPEAATELLKTDGVVDVIL